MCENLTYDDFLVQINEILTISDRINDKWVLESPNSEDPGGKFLRYKQMKSINGRIFHFDYHVLYSLSYAVPMFYFNVQDTETGASVTLEEFREFFIEKCPEIPDLNSVLTQMEHPLFYRPFLALHPCRTQELLGKFPDSHNKVTTFISLYGPFIFLNLDLEYGKNSNDENS